MATVSELTLGYTELCYNVITAALVMLELDTDPVSQTLHISLVVSFSYVRELYLLYQFFQYASEDMLVWDWGTSGYATQHPPVFKDTFFKEAYLSKQESLTRL